MTEDLEKYLNDIQMAKTLSSETGEVIIYSEEIPDVKRGFSKAQCVENAKGITNREALLRRIEEFVEKGLNKRNHVILLVNGNDDNGRPIMESCVPLETIQEIRDRGETPSQSVIINQKFISKYIKEFDYVAFKKLGTFVKSEKEDEIPVVVIDCGVAEVFSSLDLVNEE